jgi:CRISPR type I-E-associated protein CasB/Cse2
MRAQEQENYKSEFFAKLGKLSMGDMAVLKRSLGKPLSNALSAAGAFFKIMPFYKAWEEDTYFFIACAYCLFSKSNAPSKSFIKYLCELSRESDGVEKRLISLLDTSKKNSIYFYGKLSRMLRMIYQKGHTPDLKELLDDLLNWEHESRYVQLKWAREFYSKK